MKKYIVLLMVAAFAAVSYAGDKAATAKTKVKAASVDTKSACAAECSASAQVAKKPCNTKKIVMSPKAAGEVGR
jgi:hypothetical protein